MTNTLTGKVALVTGATAGIGYAIALQLAAEGAEVIVHGRNAERGAKTVQDIENAGGKARFIAADLADATDARRLADEAGDVDVLVAGIYGASKAGLDLLTKLWADEFGAKGVRVNAVSPGPTQTHGTIDLGVDLVEGLGRTTALGRTGTPEEIGNAVTFFASPAASYVNGANLTVGGGLPAIRPAA